jgi:hypothetical protein
VARRGTTDDAILSAIFTAQNWVDACIAMSRDLPKMRENLKEMDNFLAKWKTEAKTRH